MELDDGVYVHDQFEWSAGASGAMVVNDGAITASGGPVVLLGAGVQNAGTLTVDAGRASLLDADSARIELVPGGLQAVVPLVAVADAPGGSTGGYRSSSSSCCCSGSARVACRAGQVLRVHPYMISGISRLESG